MSARRSRATQESDPLQHVQTGDVSERRVPQGEEHCPSDSWRAFQAFLDGSAEPNAGEDRAVMPSIGDGSTVKHEVERRAQQLLTDVSEYATAHDAWPVSVLAAFNRKPVAGLQNVG